VWVGPLFYYELVRLARKGRGTLLRCAYALAGLVALFFAYYSRFPSYDLWDAPFSSELTIGVRDLASLSRDVVTVILWVQTAAVVVLAPPYLAGAIAEERERGTLDLLLTTQMSDREIVLGKLAARVTHLGGILLAGLPLLAATQLWGGVDFRALLAAFAVTGLNLLCVASICVLYSALSRTTRAAIGSSYATVVALSVCCFCLALGAAPVELVGVTSWDTLSWGSTHANYWLLGYTASGQAAVVLFCLTGADFGLRSGPILFARDAGKRAARATRPSDKGKTVPARPGRESPPVGDRPLLWLEAYHLPRSERLGWMTRVGSLVVVAVIAGLFARIRLSSGAPESGAVAGGLRLGLVGLAAGWCVATGFRAAGSLGRERDLRTLDGLLTLPCSRSAVLGAKWVGSILRTADAGALAGTLAGTVGLVGLITGSLHPLSVPLLAVSVAGQLCFWASLGVWLSTVFRSTLRARVALGLAVLLVFGGSWLLAAGDPPFKPSGDADNYATSYWWEPLPGAVRAYTANPVRSFWLVTFKWWGADAFDESESRDAPLFGVRLAAAAGGSLAFVTAGGLLWLDACRRFRKE
jgi:ABC-type transport system involved in multi-copper enzyme maturation permease subunit